MGFDAFDAARRHGVGVGRQQQLAGAFEQPAFEDAQTGARRAPRDLGVGQNLSLVAGGLSRHPRHVSRVTLAATPGDAFLVVDSGLAKPNLGRLAGGQHRRAQAHRPGSEDRDAASCQPARATLAQGVLDQRDDRRGRRASAVWTAEQPDLEVSDYGAARRLEQAGDEVQVTAADEHSRVVETSRRATEDRVPRQRRDDVGTRSGQPDDLVATGIGCDG
jgi:hypothetical protein